MKKQKTGNEHGPCFRQSYYLIQLNYSFVFTDEKVIDMVGFNKQGQLRKIKKPEALSVNLNKQSKENNNHPMSYIQS